MVISTMGILLYAKISLIYRPVPLTVFEIHGFKLKNKNDDKKNRRNGPFAISPMFVVQFSPKFG